MAETGSDLPSAALPASGSRGRPKISDLSATAAPPHLFFRIRRGRRMSKVDRPLRRAMLNLLGFADINIIEVRAGRAFTARSTRADSIHCGPGLRKLSRAGRRLYKNCRASVPDARLVCRLIQTASKKAKTQATGVGARVLTRRFIKLRLGQPPLHLLDLTEQLRAAPVNAQRGSLLPPVSCWCGKWPSTCHSLASRRSRRCRCRTCPCHPRSHQFSPCKWSRRRPSHLRTW
jgi:hypothetical protein